MFTLIVFMHHSLHIFMSSLHAYVLISHTCDHAYFLLVQLYLKISLILSPLWSGSSTQTSITNKSSLSRPLLKVSRFLLLLHFLVRSFVFHFSTMSLVESCIRLEMKRNRKRLKRTPEMVKSICPWHAWSSTSCFLLNAWSSTLLELMAFYSIIL